MDKDALKKRYHEILQAVTHERFNFENDKYSGVFLPMHFEEYINSKPKIMVVGRETAGWNTDNEKNTLQRIIHKNKSGLLYEILAESLKRYGSHLSDSHKSHFKRYYCKIARELGVAPEGMIYANLLAWDYNNVSPFTRPEPERSKIISISIELLAEQIKFFKPNYIVFATGYRMVDPIIKRMFLDYFGGHETTSVIPKKIWEFKAGNATCFRIAHPRAQKGNQAEYRIEVIEKIKQYTLECM